MAFDPQKEDYQRLGLRFAESLDSSDSATATREFAAFSRRFAQDRDSLPQSDADRAFHLVVRASRKIDYELPFATDQAPEEIIEDGHRILDEALSLDSHCYDAIRMKAGAQYDSFDSFLQMLNDREEEVRAYCEEQSTMARSRSEGERARLATELAMRPYLRWLATQAEEALICGRNKQAARIALEALEIDPHDMADIRFTAALAYAKLEDEQGLNSLFASNHTAGRTRPTNDAWSQLARLGLAHKLHDLSSAEAVLEELVATYPRAAEALIRQTELPDGVFARLAVVPYSEDELILALSEGSVLLQEGVDLQGRGVLSSWVIEHTVSKWPQAMLSVISEHKVDEDGEGGEEDPGFDPLGRGTRGGIL